MKNLRNVTFRKVNFRKINFKNAACVRSSFKYLTALLFLTSLNIEASVLELTKIDFARIVQFSTKEGSVELPLSQVYSVFLRHRLYAATGIEVESATMENDNQVRLVRPTLSHRGSMYPLHSAINTLDRICGRIGMKMVAESMLSEANYDSASRFTQGKSDFYRSQRAQVNLNAKLEVESLDEMGATVSSNSGRTLQSLSCKF